MSVAEDFTKAIDEVFWEAITKNRIFKDPVDFKDLDKTMIVDKIATQLKNNTYSPGIPIQFYDPKNNGVLRGKKLFEIDDMCVYYFCVVALQDPLIEKIKLTPNVFGGFRINSNLKVPKDSIKGDDEADTFLGSDDPSDLYNEPEISKIGYKKEWSDYQNLSRNLYNRGFDWYIHLDIAHFYDDIDLSILESQLRIYSDKSKSSIIDILMHLLEASSKSDYGFIRSHRGLPQEDLGEMSRVLANFYLSDFDSDFLSSLQKILSGAEFEYLRYADDMWIAIKGDKKLAYRIIQNASLILHKLRLHLNEGKTKIINREQFYNYWCFGDWDELFRVKNNIKDVVSFMQKMEKKEHTPVRWFSPYLYALRIIVSNKGNISAFKKKSMQEKFINSVISKEKLLSTKSDGITQFVAHLVINNPHLRPLLIEQINNTIMPSVEYFSLNVLSAVDSNNGDVSIEKLKWYPNMYRRLNNSNWQWYSRCIILEFMSQKYALYPTVPEYHDILSHMVDGFNRKRYVSNYIERRHQVKFIYDYSREIRDQSIHNLHSDYISRSLWRYLENRSVKITGSY